MARLTVAALEERLYEYTQTHSEEHVEDEKRLNLILKTLEEHQNNHHSRTSQVKNTAASGLTAGGVLALLLVLAEIARNFLL